MLHKIEIKSTRKKNIDKEKTNSATNFPGDKSKTCFSKESNDHFGV